MVVVGVGVIVVVVVVGGGVVVVVVVPDNSNNHTVLLLKRNCKSSRGFESKDFFEASFYYIFMQFLK